MNNLKLLGISLLVCCLYIPALSQEKVLQREPDFNKPQLFKELSPSIPVAVAELNNVLALSKAAGNVQLRLPDNRPPIFDGEIISVASKYENSIQSVVIRSSQFPGATITLSSFTNPDGTVGYSGRIISFTHGDAYELQQKNGQYQFIKRGFNEMVTE